MPCTETLTPLNLKDMLKTLFSTYKHFFFRGIGYGIVLNLPFFIYVAVYGITSLTDYDKWQGIPLVLAFLISLFFFIFCYAVICKATRQNYLGQSVDWNAANKAVISNSWSFSGTYIASIFWIVLKSSLLLLVSMLIFFTVTNVFNMRDINSLIFVGIILGIPVIVSYIFFYIHYILVIPVVSEEYKGINESLNRSRDLVSGNRWRVCGYTVFFTALPSVMIFLVKLILSLLSDHFRSVDPETIALVSFSVEIIVSIFVWFLIPILITLLYFDLIKRKNAILK